MKPQSNLLYRFCSKTLTIASISMVCLNSAQAYYTQTIRYPQNEAMVLQDVLLLSKNTLDLRLRYEYDHDQSFEQVHTYPLHSGQGLTLATKLHMQTARYYDGFLGLEFDNVFALLPHKFNSGNETTPYKIQYAEIPDPKGTALTQAYFGFMGLPDTQVIVGRQMIKLDNERFVGSDDFRQTPQTFDAVTVVNKSLLHVDLMYGYLYQVNTIWQGNHNAHDGQRQNNTHLINMSSELAPFGTVIGYAYLIDDKANYFYDVNTYGLRYLYDFDFYQAKMYFVAEYAHQSSRHDNPSFHAFYTNSVIGIEGFGTDIRVGQEILSGDSRAVGKAFRTPLASKYQFNGAASQFVETPDKGLVDSYLQTAFHYWEVDLTVQYHHYVSQRGSESYGHEWDASISRPFFKFYYLGMAYANFSGRNDFGYADVQKYWATAGIKF